MFIETSFDSVLVFLVFALAIIGLLRGFLNELASIINWFGSFYLTSKLKPLIVPFFKNKIQIPFLLDIVVNAVLFCSLIIGISILNKFLVSHLKQVVPSYTNSGLGFLFGFAKGILLTCLILAFFTVIYKKTEVQPEWLSNSFIYTSTKEKNDLFVNIINSILGDLVDENFENVNKKRREKIKKNIEKAKEIKNITDDLNSLKEEVKDKVEENVDVDDIEKLIDIINN